MKTPSEVLAAQLIVEQCHQAVFDRAEQQWIDICDKLIALGNQFALIGFLNSLLKNDIQSFRWVMYQISIRRGYEELVANFFIGTYQLEHGKNIQIVK